MTKQTKDRKKVRDNKPSRIGWECPKCGRIYAPWVYKCDRCVETPDQAFNGYYGNFYTCPRCGVRVLADSYHYCFSC